jgi:protein-arginine kinase activator protein McsA
VGVSTSDTSETVSIDNTICPKCGLAYGEDIAENNLWICCDGCDVWFDLKCTTIKSKKRLPDVYLCEDCVVSQ